MKNPNQPTKIVHSRTKSAWNIQGDVAGGKFKIARVPYFTCEDEELTAKWRKESLEHAEFISYCFNNSDKILENNNELD